MLAAVEGLPRGALAVAPLAALAAWSAISIGWSALPARSWDYADRGLVYALFALLGVYAARSSRSLALGLAGVVGALLVWSLLGKVTPAVADYGPPGVARLRGPVGLWNQLALVADFALPLALWRRRVEGALLAYVALVALALTYSRGGVLTAVLLVAAWLVLDPEREAATRVLAAAAAPAAVVVGVAFALPGVTGDGQSHHVRTRDGLVFAALLVAGAVAAALLRDVRLPRIPPRATVVASAVAAVAAVAAFVLGGSGAVGNSSGRLSSTSSNFRFTWWRQALDGWHHHLLGGTGAGSFNATNLLYRRSYLDFTIEPHDLPLQFLSETGIVGLALLALAVVWLLWGAHRRRGHELALALVFAAFVAHSLVDVDWDFVAVSAPAFLAAGALAGGGEAPSRSASFSRTLAVVGVTLLAFVALLLPSLGRRWSDDALGAVAANRPAHAVTLARRARSVDPLLVEPLYWQAAAQTSFTSALPFYRRAVDVQPRNADVWRQAGLWALGAGCPRAAYTFLEKFTELDPYERPSDGPDQYRHALRLVNSGLPKC